MNDRSRLLGFYQGWATYQRMLVDVVAPLSSAHLALPVTSPRWTIGATLQHIIANRVWWFQLWMREGDPGLAPIANWDPAVPGTPLTLSSSELVAGLHATWQMIADALSRWTPSDLDFVFHPPPELSPEEQAVFGDATRQWIIWHVLEHEIHHGGEISLMLGNKGLRGIYGGM